MQRYFLLSIFKFLLAIYCFFIGSPVKSQTHTPRTVNINGNCKGYYEYLPVNYSSNTSKKYPLIVYIHGGASFGFGTTSDLKVLLTSYEGIPNYISRNLFPNSFATPAGDSTSFIVISPQFIRTTTPLEINGVIDYLLAQNYRIDRTRIYLTGYSLGGNAAWQAPSNPTTASRLAALVPLAGYNNPYADSTARFIAGANLPVWTIHSNSDGAIPVTAAVTMINKINSFNPTIPALLSRLTNVTHNYTVQVACDPQYRPNGKNIYEWFLQYSRNFPPLANAGPDTAITLPVNSVALSASRSSDPQGGPLSYTWTKFSGPAEYSINNATAVNPVISNMLAGIYKFQVVVTNNAHLSGTATVKITVINPVPNKLPIAEAGNDVSLMFPQTTVSLSGKGSYDPDGAIESYAWSKIAGPSSFAITSPGTINTTVTNLKPGTYQFLLTVRDNQDSTGIDTVQVKVINPYRNLPPVARAGTAQTITPPVNSVTLNGSASSDSDGVITGYHWRQLNGPSLSSIGNANSVSTTAGNLVSGIYQFELTVTDDSSATGRDTVQINVNPLPKYIQVNAYGGSFPAGAGWNNWNVQSNVSSGFLLYSDGTTSSVKSALNATLSMADNGAGYPVTMCPPEVGRTAGYSYQARVLTISGLDSNKRYDFEAYASRINGNPTKYTIGSTSITILTDRNYSNKVVFTNLTPASGIITVNIDVLVNYAYLNGFTLTEIGKAGPGNVKALTGNKGSVNTGAIIASLLKQDTGSVFFGVFPNPFSDQLQLQVRNNRTGKLKITLFDQAGRIIQEYQFTKESETFRKTVLFQNLPKGIYFIQAQLADWRKAIQVIKKVN